MQRLPFATRRPVQRTGRPSRFIVAVALGCVIAVSAAPVAGTGPRGEAPRELTPDLAMALPDSLTVCGAPLSTGDFLEDCPNEQPGDRWLRFDSLLVNVGLGTFRVIASRPSTEDETLTTVQRIRRSDGSWRRIATDAVLGWALEEDGHPHWHTQGMEKYRLFQLPTRLPGGAKVGVKRGYCFFDGFLVHPELPNAPSSQRYAFSSCGVSGQSEDDLRLRVGLSVGWGDEYPWNYAGQRIDVSTIPDGRYLLCLTADPQNDFLEVRETNNESWARFSLTTTGSGASYRVAVEVLARGSSPCHEQLPYRVMRLPRS